MRKENIKKIEDAKPITTLQCFANWLALTAGKRDEIFEITHSKKAIIIIRKPKKRNKKIDN